MKKSIFAFALATVVAVASTGCGSADEGPVADLVASEDNLVEGEEVMSRVAEDSQGGDPQLTGVVSWDMIAIRKDGHEYYVFAGYDGLGKTPEHTRLEVVVEKSADGIRFTPRTVDGVEVTLEQKKLESVVDDIKDLLDDAPESALAIITNPTTNVCKKGKLSIPVKILLYALNAVTGLACGGTVLVPVIGIPSCVAFAGSAILHQQLDKRARSKCE